MADTRVKFTMKDEAGDSLWSFEGQGYGDREMMTGLVWAIFNCLEDMGQEFNFSLTVDGEGEVYEGYNYETDQPYVIKDHFELTTLDDVLGNIDLETRWCFVLEDGSLNHPNFKARAREGDYYWITEEGEYFERPGVSYLRFRSPQFVRGLIVGYNACGVDFRTKVVGKPFTVQTNGDIVYYDIQGYPIVNPPTMATKFTL